VHHRLVTPLFHVQQHHERGGMHSTHSILAVLTPHHSHYQVENVEVVPPRSIRFDFLGKDSIRYENTVEVDQRVYNNGACSMADAAAR
jgi:hypothetical protein